MFFINKKSKETATDGQLIEGFKKNEDLELLGILYNRYIHLVYGVCMKYLKNRDDSQDAVMQIFEKLIGDVPRFDIKNFKSWLHVYSRNFCLMKLRAAKSGLSVKQIDEMNKDMEFQLASHHDEEPLVLEKNLQALEKCIELLQAAQKLCVQLFFLKQKPYKEVAEETGFDIKKVKSYIQNGKRNLKICLEQNRA